jgi:hypothetical protein
MRTDYKSIRINNIPKEFISRVKYLSKNEESFEISSLIINYYMYIDKLTINNSKNLVIYESLSDMEHNLMNLKFNINYEFMDIQRINHLFTKLFELEGESILFQTMRRLGEWFLLDHKFAKELFSRQDISEIHIFSNKKSIFKEDGIDLPLIEIIKKNREHIDKNSKFYKFSDIESHLMDAIQSLYLDKDFLEMRRHIDEAHITSRDNLSYLCWKEKGSSYQMNPGSQKMDNFFWYESNIITPIIYHQIFSFDKIKLNDNYDYCKINIGLGPHKKIRYVYSTSTMIQNYFHFIRVGMSNYYKSFSSSEKLFLESSGKEGRYCPLRTDNQSEVYNMIVRENLFLNVIISFDISKYSDYLLVQLLDLIADLTIGHIDVREDFKKALRMPVKHNGKRYHALFGTFMGVKGNFDFITKGNLAIVKIAEYLYRLLANPLFKIFGLQIVGDDILVSCNDNNFPEFLRFIYSIFNCKINENKANVANNEGGTFSFTKKYYRVDYNNKGERSLIPISGVPINSFLKDIHSLNWFTSIKNNLISSNLYNERLKIMLDLLLEDNFDNIFDEFICEIENLNYNLYSKNRYNKTVKEFREQYFIEFNELVKEYKEFPLELGGFNESLTLLDIIKTDIGKRKMINLLSNNSIRYDIFKERKNNFIKLEKLIEIFGIDHPLIRKYLLEDSEIQQTMIYIEDILYKLLDYENVWNDLQRTMAYTRIKKLYMNLINLEYRSIKEEDQSRDFKSVINRTNKYYYEDKFIINLRKIDINYYPVNPLLMKIVMNSRINKIHSSIIAEMISLNGGRRLLNNKINNRYSEINDIIEQKREDLGIDEKELEDSINIVSKNIEYFKRDLNNYISNELDRIMMDRYREYYLDEMNIDIKFLNYNSINQSEELDYGPSYKELEF